MRRGALAWVLAIGCGGGGAASDAPVAPGDDAPPPVIDAPPGTPDARVRPVAACEHKTGTNLTLRRVVPDRAPREAAVLLTSPPYDPRQFIVYRDGLILISEGETLRPTPFLDVHPLVVGLEHEQGLLGLAFHPDYATNRTFYIFYATETANILARYRTTDDPYVADPDSGEVMISIPDTRPNHNGGMLAFGPDGYLYIGTGDGGGGSDADNNAENPDRLLGKILRIDVDHPDGTHLYSAPADNPFVLGGGAPEVYMYGLRNPWRWSFDVTGELYIADVGDNRYEELDIVPAATSAATNFGWDPVEGMHCNEPRNNCAMDGTTLPVWEWNHDTEPLCAVIGGVVYRGDCYPDLVGTYVFSDYCARHVYTLRADAGVVTQPPASMPDAEAPAGNFTSLYQDATGELFVTTNYGGAYHVEVGP